MNPKTRRLQVFMRALSTSNTRENRVIKVKTEMARIEGESSMDAKNDMPHRVGTGTR